MNAQGYETELVFELGESCLPCKVSELTECELELEFIVPRSDGQVIEYLTVRGARPHEMLQALDQLAEVSDVWLIEEKGDWARFQVITSGKLAKALADSETIVTNIKARAGHGKLTACVPSHVDTTTVVKGFLAEFPDAELVAKREAELTPPVWTRDQVISNILGRLTDRQLHILRTAYEQGFFEVPRRITAEEMAEAFGISGATISEHIRYGQRKVFDSLFERKNSSESQSDS